MPKSFFAKAYASRSRQDVDPLVPEDGIRAIFRDAGIKTTRAVTVNAAAVTQLGHAIDSYRDYTASESFRHHRDFETMDISSKAALLRMRIAASELHEMADLFLRRASISGEEGNFGAETAAAKLLSDLSAALNVDHLHSSPDKLREAVSYATRPQGPTWGSGQLKTNGFKGALRLVMAIDKALGDDALMALLKGRKGRPRSRSDRDFIVSLACSFELAFSRKPRASSGNRGAATPSHSAFYLFVMSVFSYLRSVSDDTFHARLATPSVSRLEGILAVYERKKSMLAVGLNLSGASASSSGPGRSPLN